MVPLTSEVLDVPKHKRDVVEIHGQHPRCPGHDGRVASEKVIEDLGTLLGEAFGKVNAGTDTSEVSRGLEYLRKETNLI